MRTLQSVVSELGGAADRATQPEQAESWITVGDLAISTWNQTVRRGGQALNLTPTEFRVLVCLAQQAGQVMTYQQIVQCAQGYEAEPGGRGADQAAHLPSAPEDRAGSRKRPLYPDGARHRLPAGGRTP